MLIQTVCVCVCVYVHLLESVRDLGLTQVIDLKCASQVNTVREKMKQEGAAERTQHQHGLSMSLARA